MSSGSIHKAPTDGLEREYKPIEEIDVGDVISGPTPGLHAVNVQANFLHLSPGNRRSGSRILKQIVLGKDMDKRKLKVLVITSFGSLKKGEDLRKRYADRSKGFQQTMSQEEYLKSLEFLVPISPTPLDPEYHQYNQPPFQVEYADNSVQFSSMHEFWVFVANTFDATDKIHDEYPGKATYSVVKGMKISVGSIDRLKKTVEEKKKKLEAKQMQEIEETNQLTTSSELLAYLKDKKEPKKSKHGRNTPQSSTTDKSGANHAKVSKDNGSNISEGSSGESITGKVKNLSILGSKSDGKAADQGAGEAPSPSAVSKTPTTWPQGLGGSYANAVTREPVATKEQKQGLVTFSRKKTANKSQTSGKPHGK